MTLLLALLLAGGALWLLAYLLRILVAAAGLPLGGSLERWRFRRYIDRARQADVLLHQHQTDAALALLRDAFCLTVFNDLELAHAVVNHHTGVLSRLLTITAETVRPLSLAKVDRLLRERNELQRTFIAVRQSPGKRERRHQLLQQLANNRKELEPVIAQLIEETRRAAAAPVYH